MIALVVAASENNVIGDNGNLPWHLPKDLKFFKDLTWGMVIIMGRKTYEANEKPLPGRVNVVMTSKADWEREGVLVAHTVNEALRIAKSTNCKDYYVIGGGEIYKEFLPITDRIYMTRVHAEVEGDAFFPEFSTNEFHLVSSKRHEKDEKHQFSFTFEVWDKVKK